MLKQSLNQKFLQKLSPQQIQLMKLQGEEEYEDGEDAFAKDKESEKENADNEEIERDDEYELDDYLTEYLEDDPSSYKLNANNYSADDEDKTVPIAVEDTFHEYLEQQLGMLKLADERVEKVAKQIIGSIDDDGYLRREPEAIKDDLVFSQNIETSIEEINALLSLIQRFDPPGIGSRNLQECLELQLRHRLETATDLCDEEERIIRITIRIVSEYFDEFSKKHYQKLQRQLNITEGQLRSCIEQVLKLNPKPACAKTSNKKKQSFLSSKKLIRPNGLLMRSVSDSKRCIRRCIRSCNTNMIFSERVIKRCCAQ